MVEEGNLFDPGRPGLGSELEALRQHLEALGAGPGAWRSPWDRPAGVSWAGGAYLCPWRGARLRCQRGLNPSCVTSCLGLRLGLIFSRHRILTTCKLTA